jgi:hypothetical protein
MTKYYELFGQLYSYARRFVYTQVEACSESPDRYLNCHILLPNSGTDSFNYLRVGEDGKFATNHVRLQKWPMYNPLLFS